MTNSIKNLMILLALVTGFASVQAQSLSVGVRGGINLANIAFEDEDYFGIEPERRLSLDFGLLFNIGISENFSIQPEIHYMQKGYRSEFEEMIFQETVSTDQNVLINYLEIPVLAKVGLGNETVQLMINAGPSLGYALNGRTEIEIDAFGMKEKEEEDIDFGDEENEDFNRLDFSLLFGAGIGFNTGPATIFVDARYLLGLTDLDDSGDEDIPAARNRGLGFGLGVLIPIGE